MTEEMGFCVMVVNGTHATAVVVGGCGGGGVLKVLLLFRWLALWRWRPVTDRVTSRTQNGHRGGEGR
jgi:hypothetical protein